jgi:translation initiation factor IF-1
MVKNTTGGKGAKSFARKNEGKGGGRLRLSTHPDEIYAIVTNALGNCRFYVNTIKGQRVMMHVGGKFSGRNKRNNFVGIGSYVLIGLRDYASGTGDLLELYSDSEVKQLASLPGEHSSFFYQTKDTLQSESLPSAEEVIFTNDDSIMPLDNTTNDMKMKWEVDMNEEINIDDI